MIETLKKFGAKKLGGLILIVIIIIAFGFGGFGFGRFGSFGFWWQLLCVGQVNFVEDGVVLLETLFTIKL